MNIAIALANRGASLLCLTLTIAAFGIAAEPQCGTRVIYPKTEFKLYHHIHGTPTPNPKAVDLSLSGRLYYTRGRIRVLGELSVQIDPPLIYSPDSETWDTFDRTLFDVAQDAPGCAISRVSNKSTGFEPRLWAYYNDFPAGTNMPLPGDKYGVLWPSTCTNWVPGTQAGKVGCTLAFAPITVELVPIATLPCTTTSVRLESSVENRAYPFEIPLIRQQGDDVIASPEVNVNVSGALTWSENRVQLENSAFLRELGGDYSVYSGSRTTTLFDVSRDAPGCRITNVSARTERFRGFDYSAANDPKYFSFNTFVYQTQPYVGDYRSARCNTAEYQACKVSWNEIDFTVYLGSLTTP